MRFTSTGTAITMSGLSVVDPIIILEVEVMHSFLIARIYAYTSLSEELDGGDTVLLRKKDSREYLSEVRVDINNLKSSEVGQSIFDIINLAAKNYLENNLDITIN